MGFILFPVIALITWAPWYGAILLVNPLAARRSHRVALAVTPLACLTLILVCLERLGARAVRASWPYILMYLGLGAAVLGISVHLFSFLGISARDDVLERRNTAGLVAIIGALLGATFCFAGGNIGEGPGIAVVIASAGAALASWFPLWYLADRLSGQRISERITVERDTGSGIRLGAMLAASGIILGTAAAGNWIPDRFLHDFALSAWPALWLSIAAALGERLLKPRSSVPVSILVGISYLLVAIAWMFHRGSA